MKNNIITIFTFFMIVSSGFANVVLPSFFSDNMVLQRNSKVSIWGWAGPNEEIVVKASWDNVEYKVKPSNQAYWEIKIETPQAGGPYNLLVKGYNEIVIKNILIGEVWLCSGQSNMEMSVHWGILNGEEESKIANHPNIRLLTVPKISATVPQNNLPVNWVSCTPDTMKAFSAVGYFFGKKLQEDLKGVPVGLICAAWGGTPAEIWTPEEAIKNNPIVQEEALKLSTTEYGPKEPARAFNAMINPFIGYKIAGVIWYQGEANVEANHYEQTLNTLVNSWRTAWKDNFPFYYVQIAPYVYGTGTGNAGVSIRNAQRKALEIIPNTGMVVISDVATADDIHPKDKKSVGIRLANLALKNTYNIAVGLVESPLFKKVTFEKDKAFVYFDYADGLYCKNGKSTLFEVAASNGNFEKATAVIKNNMVIVQSGKVKNPTMIRYAWKNDIASDLFNKSNLPVSSFTTQN